MRSPNGVACGSAPLSSPHGNDPLCCDGARAACAWRDNARCDAAERGSRFSLRFAALDRACEGFLRLFPLAISRFAFASSFSKSFPFSAAAISRRHGALWISQWRWPVWPNERHVCLRGYVPFLRGQIRPPASKATCLRVHLLLLAQWSLVPA